VTEGFLFGFVNISWHISYYNVGYSAKGHDAYCIHSNV